MTPTDIRDAAVQPELPLVPQPPKPGSTYDRILAVVKMAKGLSSMRNGNAALAVHEFDSISMNGNYYDSSMVDRWQTGREFIGCSEATLARRCREMVGHGWLKVKKRAGKNFVEYSAAI